MIKKIIILILLITPVTFGETIEFIDVSQSDWYYDYLETFTRENMIAGYEDHTFRPQNTISVEEFITLLIKVLDEKKAPVDTTWWSDGFIARAIELNIIQKDDFSDYRRPISRGEMSRIILRSKDFNYPNNYLDYGYMITDFSSFDSYWQDIVSKTFAIGIISGYPDGTFKKDATANRAEALAILYKLYDSDSIVSPPFESQVSNRILSIKAKKETLSLETLDQYFLQSPSFMPPYDPGQLKASVIKNGENTLNLIRFIAGLKPVVTTDDANQSSQAGALLTAVSEFSHYPLQPSAMNDTLYTRGYSATSTGNLAAGMSSVEDAIFRLMDDEDAYNISKLGHRRWFLYPDLYEFGIGFVSKEEDPFHYYHYSVFKVFKDLSKQSQTYDYITWPSDIAFPIDYIRDDLPWSVSLNPDIYDSSKTQDIWVEFKSNTLNQSIPLDSSDQDVNGQFFTIDTKGYGTPFCIVFRPLAYDYQVHDKIEITIHNLYLKSGLKTDINYSTTLFNY